MNIELLPAYDCPKEIAELFSEYTQTLVAGDPNFQGYLNLQNYDEEVKHLEIKYGKPDGRLYLVRVDGKTAGCVGLRKIGETNCELKRLYVRPEYRGQHLAGMMTKQVISDAKEIGYHHMLLDTLPFLTDAIRMYRNYGFYEVPSYNNSPMDNLIYLKLDLTGDIPCLSQSYPD